MPTLPAKDYWPVYVIAAIVIAVKAISFIAAKSPFCSSANIALRRASGRTSMAARCAGGCASVAS
ncbi:hypothetical protein HAX54_052096, partial [Datura stramonium]|nr:hypothetical protein [Datura stramonium]